MKEIWKTIKNYPNYKISNFGNIKRVPHFFRSTEMLLKLIITKLGYYRLQLYKNGKPKHFTIHRLVACHFVSNPKNLLCVNHKDGNKLNNRVNNLEWCTQSYNVKHAFDNKLKFMTRGEDCSWHKLSNEQVLDIRAKHKIGSHNMRELAEIFKINKTTVWGIIHREIWSHI